MSWNTLQPQIDTLLESLTDGGNAIFQEVSLDPKAEFSGYPAAFIAPSENAGDYETNKENERVYAFVITILYETKKKTNAQAFSALRSLVDTVIDALDQEDLKGSATRTIGINLPARYTFINIWATTSRWFELPEEEMIGAEVRVRVRTSIDIT